MKIRTIKVYWSQSFGEKLRIFGEDRQTRSLQTGKWTKHLGKERQIHSLRTGISAKNRQIMYTWFIFQITMLVYRRVRPGRSYRVWKMYIYIYVCVCVFWRTIMQSTSWCHQEEGNIQGTYLRSQQINQTSKSISQKRWENWSNNIWLSDQNIEECKWTINNGWSTSHQQALGTYLFSWTKMEKNQPYK